MKAHLRTAMNDAPRDGTPIIIAVGSDFVGEARYVDDPADPYPWKFMDVDSRGKIFINGWRDDHYGPTDWRPMPGLAKP